MTKTLRVKSTIKEIFANDAEFLPTLEKIRGESREAAQFVKKLRKSAGLTQRDLAARLGISQPRISAMERGIGPDGPSYLMLKRVADACKIPWSLEAGLGRSIRPGKVETSGDKADHAASAQQRRRTARLVEEVLQSNAPRALRPAEIRSAIESDKGVAMGFTSIRHALDELEARRVAEQITDRKTWRYRSKRGGSASLRHE
jgi:transcriptional regulator with XRE-family HTH domain